MHSCLSLVSGLLVWAGVAFGQGIPERWSWTASGPLIGPRDPGEDTYYSVKDPSVVSEGGSWHVFATVRGRQRSHQIEYLRFRSWEQPVPLERQFLRITNGYYCAPQVFYFRPTRRWCLLYQASDTNRPVALQPAMSTNERLEAWEEWTKPVFLFEKHPANIKGWIDFWVICDEERAYLFFTSNNGLMWRCSTSLNRFPHGWTLPELALKDDLFEASHTYRVQGTGQYMTVVEAQAGVRRYYKAYVADRLDGEWRPLAASREQPFAGSSNVDFGGNPWAESISHGELLRSSNDERCLVDPANWAFVFQGALDREIQGRTYGLIPWRLGLLRSRR